VNDPRPLRKHGGRGDLCCRRLDAWAWDQARRPWRRCVADGWTRGPGIKHGGRGDAGLPTVERVGLGSSTEAVATLGCPTETKADWIKARRPWRRWVTTASRVRTDAVCERGEHCETDADRGSARSRSFAWILVNAKRVWHLRRDAICSRPGLAPGRRVGWSGWAVSPRQQRIRRPEGLRSRPFSGLRHNRNDRSPEPDAAPGHAGRVCCRQRGRLRRRRREGEP
jgi:hypothetical protein